MTSRDLQKRQTRQAFFQSVLELSMSGHAFSSISLRQISREVGVVPTAFYRHFQDINELGRCLVTEELGHTLQSLREHLELGRTRTREGQIAASVRFFLESVEGASSHWHFIVSERYGGNQAVQSALDEQISLFTKIMTDDLAMQPAFDHLPHEVRLLIADMGVNMYFSWVYQWLKFDAEDSQGKQAYMTRCIKQAQVLFYGVSNWRP